MSMSSNIEAEDGNFSVFKKNIFTNSFWVSFRYVVIAVIGLAVSVAFAHLATKETFGQYQFILSIVAIFYVFSLTGLNIAALKSVSQGKSGSVSKAVRLSFLGSVFAIPFLVGYGIYILTVGNYSASVGWAFVLLGLLFPFLYASNTWYVHYEGRLLFRPVAIRTIASSAVTAILLFVGLWNHMSVFWLSVIWFFSTALFSWFFYWEVLREEKKFVQGKDELDVRYGLWVSFQKFVVSLTENIPTLAISFFIGFEAVANFQIASVFVGAVSGLLGALTAMALPVIFSNIEQTHRGLLFYNVLSGALASFGYFILVEVLFLAVYGERYRESFELARLLVILPFLVSLRMFFVNIFTAKGKNTFIVSVYVVANILSMILFIVMFKTAPFVWSAGAYLYSINLLLLIPLAFAYFFNASKKTDSI